MGIFQRREKWGNFNGNINIYEDLKLSDIPRISNEENIHSLQFFQFKNPKNKTWDVLNTFYQKNPKIGLRIVWYDQMSFDFYHQLPALRNIDISSFLTSDYTPLLANKKITDLGIGETKSTAVDLSFIKEFQNLSTLWINGMKKGLDSVKELTNLERLTFRGVKMKNLEVIEDLDKLKQLRLLFGSYKNLESIAKLKSIKTLEISRTRQIPNYDFLQTMSNLHSLYLEGMSKMEALPDLSGLTNLRRVQIDNNRRLTDITNLNQLAKLEILIFNFPENFKAAHRKEIYKQASDVLLKSTTIKYTNLFLWLGDDIRNKLVEKGIKKWDYGMDI